MKIMRNLLPLSWPQDPHQHQDYQQWNSLNELKWDLTRKNRPFGFFFYFSTNMAWQKFYFILLVAFLYQNFFFLYSLLWLLTGSFFLWLLYYKVSGKGGGLEISWYIFPYWPIKRSVPWPSPDSVQMGRQKVMHIRDGTIPILEFELESESIPIQAWWNRNWTQNQSLQPVESESVLELTVPEPSHHWCIWVNHVKYMYTGAYFWHSL